MTVTAVGLVSSAAVVKSLVYSVGEQGERNAPGGEEVAEYLTVYLLTGSPSLVPEGSTVVEALVGVILGLVNPSLDLRINGDLAVCYPGSGNVVGEASVCIVITGYHEDACVLHLLDLGLEIGLGISGECFSCYDLEATLGSFLVEGLVDTL